MLLSNNDIDYPRMLQTKAKKESEAKDVNMPRNQEGIIESPLNPNPKPSKDKAVEPRMLHKNVITTLEHLVSAKQGKLISKLTGSALEVFVPNESAKSVIVPADAAEPDNDASKDVETQRLTIITRVKNIAYLVVIEVTVAIRGELARRQLRKSEYLK